MTTESSVYVPKVDPTYVAWGDHDFLKSVVDRRKFFPVNIVGPTGTGKSIMAEQVCAELGRAYCRIQITPESDEDSLIGGVRLTEENGVTVTTFQYGPVVEAMKAGAVLMIDEMDRGSNKIMCLQAVMEGKPIVIKRTNEVIEPHPDFTIIATSNTKGRGDDSGKYMAAVIIDDAFLERFPVVIEHDYPEPSIEASILSNHMQKFGVDDELVERSLLRWAQQNREQADEDETVISTRRLCLIAETMAFFKGQEDFDTTAITMGTNRFEKEDQAALISAYENIRPDVKAEMKAAQTQKELDDHVAKHGADAKSLASKIIKKYENRS